ncbi:MAG TPA: restriction endonuclease subunit S [Candidatus Saccharicenans sp.]|nr:restriction endonuclease subunit S [Candidatus Saccharicenans sp.]
MNKKQKSSNKKMDPLPDGWRLVRLGDSEIAEIRGSKKFPNYENVAFIPMEYIPDSGIYAKYEVRPRSQIKSFTYCEKGDLLLAKITPSLENGKQGIVPDNVPNGFALATTEVFPISCKRMNSLFLFYVLKHSCFRNKIISSMTGTTGRQRATKESVEKLFIPFPPLFEQVKIAEILSTVDQAIQKIIEAIEKTERLKKGLMRELLTKGIGHKEFKNTELGKLPKGWDIRQLYEVVYINRESVDPARDFPSIPFIYIDIDSVENETGLIKAPKEILGKNAPLRARRVVHHNDVIISTVRPYLRAFAIIPAKYDKQICSTGFAVLSCKEVLLPYFLFHVAFSEPFIAQCNRMMVGGQYPALNSSQVSRLKLPLPSIAEQSKIAEILNKIDERLEALRKRKERLEKVKKGLMEDLLTGKKRVKLED